MNYLDTIAREIAGYCVDFDADGDIRLYRLYALLLLAKGEAVTDEDVHNAWAAWATEHKPHSVNIVPFDGLSRSVQDQDRPFRDAIRDVVKREIERVLKAAGP